MANDLLHRRVLALLQAIERDEITLTIVEAPQYIGSPKYRTSNGWLLVVFNDCDEWDYLDAATGPDHSEWSYEQAIHDAKHSEAAQTLLDYEPPEAQLGKWGF